MNQLYMSAEFNKRCLAALGKIFQQDRITVHSGNGVRAEVTLTRVILLGYTDDVVVQIHALNRAGIHVLVNPVNHPREQGCHLRTGQGGHRRKLRLTLCVCVHTVHQLLRRHILHIRS